MISLKTKTKSTHMFSVIPDGVFVSFIRVNRRDRTESKSISHYCG